MEHLEKVWAAGVVSDIRGSDAKILDIERLKGDASARSYLRVRFVESGLDNSMIAVLIPKDDDRLSSLCGEYFLDIQRYLKGIGIGVPDVYRYIKERGVIFIEDLGDTTFESSVNIATPDIRYKYYKDAIDLLIKMQCHKINDTHLKCLAFTYRFDMAKFLEELEFFLNHFVTGIVKKDISCDRERIINLFARMCHELIREDYCFTHRDYHSRNIMIKDGHLRVIDFQDARLGPYQYDIASLLRDSYIVLDRTVFENLLKYYISGIEDALCKSIDYEHFRRLFDYMSIQRNLKAVGTFAYQSLVKGNPRYLSCIPPTLKYVAENLSKYRELGDIQGYLLEFGVFDNVTK